MKQKFIIAMISFFVMYAKAQPISLLKDIVPGTGNSNRNPASETININGTIYFTATTSTQGTELWKTTGTAASTVLVKDIVAGSTGSNPNSFLALGSKLFFWVTLNTGTQALYVSDGSAGGTIKLLEFAANSSKKPVIYNGYVYQFTGKDIYRTNGSTAGTVKVITMTENINLLAANSTGLYFSSDRALFTSNGTQAGTLELKRILLNPGYPVPYITDLQTTSYNCFVLLETNILPTHNVEIWRSNGTVQGTNVAQSFGGADILVNNFFTMADKLFFQYWPLQSPPVYTTLSMADAVQVKEIAWKQFKDEGASNFIMNGTDDLYYSMDVVTGINTFQYQIYKANITGNPVNPILLRTINAEPNGYSYLSSGLFAANGRLYFTNTDNALGCELWTSDGTVAGTQLLKDINPGPASSYPERFFSFNNSVYFVANNGSQGKELWKTDGTPSGTLMVQDRNPGIADFSPSSLCARGNGIFMFANTAANGIEPHFLPNCAPGQNPTISSSHNSSIPVCYGTTITLSVPANIGIGNNKKWYWYAGGSCSGTPIDSGQSITRTLTAASSFSVRGEGGCAAATICASFSIGVINCSIGRNAAPEKTSEQQPAPLKIYPNPARQQITIEANKTETALLLNSQAVLVQQLKLRLGSNRINIHHLPAGMYLVKTASGQTQRFEIIQ